MVGNDAETITVMYDDVYEQKDGSKQKAETPVPREATHTYTVGHCVTEESCKLSGFTVDQVNKLCIKERCQNGQVRNNIVGTATEGQCINVAQCRVIGFVDENEEERNCVAACAAGYLVDEVEEVTKMVPEMELHVTPKHAGQCDGHGRWN